VGGHKKNFSALRAEITHSLLCPSSFETLPRASVIVENISDTILKMESIEVQALQVLGVTIQLSPVEYCGLIN